MYKTVCVISAAAATAEFAPISLRQNTQTASLNYDDGSIGGGGTKSAYSQFEHVSIDRLRSVLWEQNVRPEKKKATTIVSHLLGLRATLGARKVGVFAGIVLRSTVRVENSLFTSFIYGLGSL